MAPRFLTRSAERTVVAHRLWQLAPDADALLLADGLDQACAELLRDAGLTDDQAREIPALLWTPPKAPEHYVAITTRVTYWLTFDGERWVRKLIGRFSYGWECITCHQTEAPHYDTKDEAARAARHVQAARQAATHEDDDQ